MDMRLAPHLVRVPWNLAANQSRYKIANILVLRVFLFSEVPGDCQLEWRLAFKLDFLPLFTKVMIRLPAPGLLEGMGLSTRIIPKKGT